VGGSYSGGRVTGQLDGFALIAWQTRNMH